MTRIAPSALVVVWAASALFLAACSPTEPEQTALLSVVNVPEDAASLQEAHALVAPGGTIFVNPGVYEEQLEITTPDVTVRGTDRNNVIIDGGGIRPFGIVATADGVRIENLTVRNATFYGVLVTGLSDANVPSVDSGSAYEPFDPEEFPPLERFSIQSLCTVFCGFDHASNE